MLTIRQFREEKPCYVEDRVTALCEHLGYTPDPDEPIPFKAWFATFSEVAPELFERYRLRISDVCWGVRYLPDELRTVVACRLLERILQRPVSLVSSMDKDLCLQALACIRDQGIGHNSLRILKSLEISSDVMHKEFCRLNSQHEYVRADAMHSADCLLSATHGILGMAFYGGNGYRALVNAFAGVPIEDRAVLLEALIADVLELAGES